MNSAICSESCDSRWWLISDRHLFQSLNTWIQLNDVSNIYCSYNSVQAEKIHTLFDTVYSMTRIPPYLATVYLVNEYTLIFFIIPVPHSNFSVLTQTFTTKSLLWVAWSHDRPSHSSHLGHMIWLPFLTFFPIGMCSHAVRGPRPTHFAVYLRLENFEKLQTHTTTMSASVQVGREGYCGRIHTRMRETVWWMLEGEMACYSRWRRWFDWAKLDDFWCAVWECGDVTFQMSWTQPCYCHFQSSFISSSIWRPLSWSRIFDCSDCLKLISKNCAVFGVVQSVLYCELLCSILQCSAVCMSVDTWATKPLIKPLEYAVHSDAHPLVDRTIDK